MITLTIELSTELYECLQAEAEEAGETLEDYARRLITEGLVRVAAQRNQCEQMTTVPGQTASLP